MTDDVRLANSFRTHRKTKRLKRALGAEGVLGLIYFWAWVGAEHWSGDLTGLTDEDIEDSIDWEGARGAFVAALTEVKFLDGPEGARQVHDWVKWNPYAASKGARIARGKAGAAARWNKDQGELPLGAGSIESDATSMQQASDSVPGAMLEQCPPAPAPAPAPAPSRSKSESNGARAVSEAESTAEALTAAGCPDVHGLDPRLNTALRDGIPAAELIALAKTNKGQGKGIAYLIRTIVGQRNDADKASQPVRPTPPPPESSTDAERRRLENEIIEARHFCDVSQTITPEARDQRISAANAALRALAKRGPSGAPPFVASSVPAGETNGRDASPPATGGR